MTAKRLEALSKILVFASILAAFYWQAVLGNREWRPLGELSAVAFVAGFLVARWRTGAAWAAVLVVSYVLPFLFQATIGRFQLTHQIVWLGAIMGVIIARGPWTRWSFPPRWKTPLIYWALVVALVWPVLIAREADFRSSMLLNYQMGSSGMGAPPPFVELMVINVALTYLVGLLCFDAWFAVFGPGERRSFSRAIIWSLAVSIVLSCAVALYQGLVDLNWMSAHGWAWQGRAAGGLVDGDGFGAIAGFWSSAFFGLAGTPVGWAAAAVGSLIAWGGLWASGSRMALLAGLIGLAFVVAGAVANAPWRRTVPIFAGLVVVIVLASLAGAGRWGNLSPLQRTMESLPDLSPGSIQRFAVTELYDRSDPYGSGTVWMLARYPVSGIGLGNFYSIFPDVAYLLIGRRAGFENAQSWYRHQLAELGVLGSLGWLWFLGGVVWLLVRTHGDVGARFPAAAVKGTLVSIGAVSALSLPTQVIPTSFTVWALIFWYLTISTEGRAHVSAAPRWQNSRAALAATLALALVFVGHTYWVAHAELRPPFRAVEADWDYHRGLREPERLPDGLAFRWTLQNAVAVFPIEGRYLKLTIWANNPDLSDHPLDVRIERHGEPIIHTTLTTSVPQTWYVRAVPKAPRMMLETWVDRTWRPADFGQNDTRELGIAIADWTFVDTPPPGAAVIE